MQTKFPDYSQCSHLLNNRLCFGQTVLITVALVFCLNPATLRADPFIVDPVAPDGGNGLCRATRLNDLYPANSNARLRSPPIDLTGVTAVALSFCEYRDFDSFIDGHGTVVNILDAVGDLMEELFHKAGQTDGWERQFLNLGSGSVDRTIILEFHLYSDAYNLREGWYIDDVMSELC